MKIYFKTFFSLTSIHLLPTIYIWFKDKDRHYPFWEEERGVAASFLFWTLEVRLKETLIK